ncbi:MAG: putative bifunctional diguanylate cyclase/phosphodiesterase [Acidimicrobiia bacterium]
MARKRSPGIVSRLVALVLFPTAAFTAVTAMLLVDRRTTVNESAEVTASADELASWQSVRIGAFDERVVTSTVLRSNAAGYSVEASKLLLGFDLAKRRDEGRRSLDQALAALPDQHLIDTTELAGIRARADAGAITDSEFTAYFERIDRSVNGKAAEITGRLSDCVKVMGSNDEIQNALTGVVQSSESVRYAATAFDDYSLAILSLTDSVVARARLGSAMTRFEMTQRSIGEVAIGDLKAAFEKVQTSDSLAVLDASWTEVLTTIASGGTPSPLGLPKVAQSMMGTYSLLGEQSRAAQSSLRAAAATVSQEATDSYRFWIYVVGITTFVTLAAAMFVGRRIVHPLRRLSSVARQVVDGDLDVEALMGQGPAEVSMAMGAFNDLVGNLRLIEDQALALASTDFEADALRQSVPGRLGDSLRESVQTLSASVREREHLQVELSHQAAHDGLTGLLNRTALVESLDAALARCRRHGSLLAVYFVDLDHFKRANDTYGHQVGDLVLRTAAERMTEIVRKGDVVARLGGDEFAIVSESAVGPAEAVQLGHRLIQAMTEPFVFDQTRVSIGASVGVAFSFDAVEGPLDLLAKADIAVYQSKQKGRGRVELFDGQLQQQMIEAGEIEAALREALEREELELHYQPVWNNDGRRLWGAEALIRWDRPGLGMQSPSIFIPIAESSPLIIAIDRWVMRKAMKACARWHRELDAHDLSVSVNVSGRHLLTPEFVDDVAAALAESGVEPSWITLEVTETVLLTDLNFVAVQLAKVRDLGVRVSIDDFGTGYTSLAHLRFLPVDTIKIDRSFIAAMEEARDRSLVQMVVDLGRALDVTIVAEGVETPEQLAALRRLGCDKVQGYLLGRPMTEAAFGDQIRAEVHGAVRAS